MTKRGKKTYSNLPKSFTKLGPVEGTSHIYAREMIKRNKIFKILLLDQETKVFDKLNDTQVLNILQQPKI